jgi:hypothetical protein
MLPYLEADGDKRLCKSFTVSHISLAVENGRETLAGTWQLYPGTSQSFNGSGLKNLAGTGRQ